MAAIDKTYITAQELKEAIVWAESVGVVTLDNGYKFSPIEYIYAYNDVNDPDFDWNQEEYCLWNTPYSLDRWLWDNCPLTFVKDRIEFQYDEKTLNDWTTNKPVWHDPKNNLDFGRQHYKFLKYPKWTGRKWWMNNARKNNPWNGKQLTYYIEIICPNKDWRDDLNYDEQTNNWYSDSSPWPHYCRNYTYVWQVYHKRIPNKKSIIRTLRQWYIPKGYIVKVYNIHYTGLDFEILVK